MTSPWQMVGALGAAISGVAALLALIFAGVAARAAHKQLKFLELDRERDLASRVDVWIESDARVMWCNGASVPVRDARLYVCALDVLIDLDLLPPVSEPTEHKDASAHFLQDLAAYEGKSVDTPREELLPSAEPLSMESEEQMVYMLSLLAEGTILSFRDGAGHHWKRTDDGHLEKLPDDFMSPPPGGGMLWVRKNM